MLEPTTVGVMNYNVLRNILVQGGFLKLNRGAEIGVLNGDTSFYLLNELPALTLFCVDPYLEYHDGDRMRGQTALNEYEAAARSRMAPFGPRAQFVKATSLEGAKVIPDGSLDFVFIDANHSYDNCLEDMNAWYSKVRNAGLFCGHDFRWEGVRKAVEDFGAKHSLKGFFTPAESDIWFFVRP